MIGGVDGEIDWPATVALVSLIQAIVALMITVGFVFELGTDEPGPHRRAMARGALISLACGLPLVGPLVFAGWLYRVGWADVIPQAKTKER